MFTGIIQALGTIRPLKGDCWQINCTSRTSDAIWHDLAEGDSVAVDGVCLTVETILKDGFIATASPETLRRTTLGIETAEPRYVNLETSLRVGSKIGGHFVTGHVDGTGQMLAVQKQASCWQMTFTAPEAIARYIVPKGSIAINGVSLTVADYQPETCQFQVAVIPLTYAETNLRYLVPGSKVNLEGDILGKYVEKFLALDKQDRKLSTVPDEKEITPLFLAEHGYM